MQVRSDVGLMCPLAKLSCNLAGLQFRDKICTGSAWAPQGLRNPSRAPKICTGSARAPRVSCKLSYEAVISLSDYVTLLADGMQKKPLTE